MNYKKRLFLNISAVLILFTVVIVSLQYQREKTAKRENILNRLTAFTLVAQNYISEQNKTLDSIDYRQLFEYLPDQIRLTVIDKTGRVLFDNFVEDVSKMENHLLRPEIQESIKNKKSNSLRYSVSTNDDYLYQSTYFEGYFVRMALPYNVNLKLMLRADNLDIYLVLFFFVVAISMFVLISGKFSKSLIALRRFSQDPTLGVSFPDSELGAIGDALKRNYMQIQNDKELIKTEKERLIKHFSHLNIGLAFFDKDLNLIYSNTLFNAFLNKISANKSLRAEDLWETKQLSECVEAIKDFSQNNVVLDYDKVLNFGVSHYAIRAFAFEDKSIEITIDDISAQENNRRLKLEMTNNISHELRTPIASITGYLETIVSTQSMSEATRTQFIQKAYKQSLRLADLVRDVSELSKIESNKENLQIQELKLSEIIEDIKIEFSARIQKQNALVENAITQDFVLKGNYNLIYTIFRNLVDNSLKYSSTDTKINIQNIYSDDNFHYFSVRDNGFGVAPEHLEKIFERFYRPTEGRTRRDGGSGLGLSIVKNAIAFHNGTVKASNLTEGGLEVVFSLKK